MEKIKVNYIKDGELLAGLMVSHPASIGDVVTLKWLGAYYVISREWVHDADASVDDQVNIFVAEK